MLQNPIIDANLEAKFHGLSDPVLGAAASAEMINACWNFAAAADMRGLAALAVPQA